MVGCRVGIPANFSFPFPREWKSKILEKTGIRKIAQNCRPNVAVSLGRRPNHRSKTDNVPSPADSRCCVAVGGVGELAVCCTAAALHTELD